MKIHGLLRRKLTQTCLLPLTLAGVLITASGQNCAPATPEPFAASIEGTWKGTMTSTGTMTVPGFGSMSIGTVTADLELSVWTDGRPTSLPLRAMLQGGGGDVESSSSAFTPGESTSTTHSYDITINGSTTTVTVVSTVTVREADAGSTHFHTVYDYTMNASYAGGMFSGFSQLVTGSATYDATLSGDTLSYTEAADYEFEQSMSGFTQTGSASIDTTAELTRS
jgi:hypothetical protein